VLQCDTLLWLLLRKLALHVKNITGIKCLSANSSDLLNVVCIANLQVKSWEGVVVKYIYL